MANMAGNLVTALNAQDRLTTEISHDNVLFNFESWPSLCTFSMEKPAHGFLPTIYQLTARQSNTVSFQVNGLPIRQAAHQGERKNNITKK
ncbi:MAG: hypothetical protein KKA54_11585 [Proteobacteria bacterium]|nr:hypothetical protein [Pseudomonadota bacterium]